MEEILASIRRIISDDQAVKPAASQPPAVQPAALAPVQPAPVQPTAAPAALEPAAHAAEEEEILDLSPKAAMRPERRPEPHFITDDPVDSDVSFQEAKSEPAKGQDDIDALMAAADFAPVVEETATGPERSPFETAPLEHPLPEPAQPMRLLSPSTDHKVSSAFNSLASTVLANNGRTLDDLVHEMLKPLIKGWLDENLPNVVERLVRAEIERVARGGR